MEQYSQIIILSKDYESTNDDILVIKDKVILEDDMHIICNGITYNFDYLIFTNLLDITNFRSTNILHENEIPVTNYFYQTTYENIYYTESINIDKALENIYESDL